jgi:RNA polymerase sigma factor (sigma-70 family)
MDESRNQHRTTDAELLRASARDPEAFAELYRRHAVAVYSWLHRRQPQIASDLTAETFARAWLHRRRFRDRRGGTALPWLLGIAANLLSDAIRRERVETRARERLGLPTEQTVESDADAIVARLSPDASIERELASLPAPQREALELRVVQELTYDEVADRLSIRNAAARLRVSRALRHLSHTIEREDP